MINSDWLPCVMMHCDNWGCFHTSKKSFISSKISLENATSFASLSVEMCTYSEEYVDIFTQLSSAEVYQCPYENPIKIIKFVYLRFKLRVLE